MNEKLIASFGCLWIILCLLLRSSVQPIHIFSLGRQEYEKHADTISLSSATRGLSCLSTERLIEMNKKRRVFPLSTAPVWKKPLARNGRVKLFIAAHRFPSLIADKYENKKWRTAREARRLFRGILPLLEDCPLLWKRFFFKANGGDITHSPPN